MLSRKCLVLLGISGFGALILGSGYGYWILKGRKSPSNSGPPSLSLLSDPYSVSKAKPAPRFELKDASGKVHRLHDYRDKLVLLHFWASWCPPCLDEIPQWVELATRFKDQPVQLVAISLDDAWEEAQKVLPDRNLPANLISVLDVTTKLPEEYGTYQFPETYLLDGEQKIIAKWVGPQDWSRPGTVGAIEKSLKAMKR